MKDLIERLLILKSNDVITENAHWICHKTMEKFVPEKKAESYTMLITHLAMAVTRMEREEPLHAPPLNIMEEIYHSPNLEEARMRVEWIESALKKQIPKEEKDFLYMHFVSVLTA